MINESQLAQIILPTKYRPAELELITVSLQETCRKFGINTPLRLAYFLSQVLHESGCFKYKGEIWGNTEAQKRYDTREDLGNTPEKDGDGYKYRGRGWMQITGKGNYRKASLALGVDFVKNPDLAAEFPYVAFLAGWFWQANKINDTIDKALKLAVPKGHTQEDVVLPYVTKKVNGGFNGLEDRKKWLLKAKQILCK